MASLRSSISCTPAAEEHGQTSDGIHNLGKRQTYKNTNGQTEKYIKNQTNKFKNIPTEKKRKSALYDKKWFLNLWRRH